MNIFDHFRTAQSRCCRPVILCFFSGLVICGNAGSLSAQAQTKHSAKLSVHQNQSSVLERESESDQVPDLNSATIDTQATFTAQPMPPAPKLPALENSNSSNENSSASTDENISVPQTPSAHSFTQTQKDEITSETIATGEAGTEAKGTFAAQQPQYQFAMPSPPSRSNSGMDQPGSSPPLRFQPADHPQSSNIGQNDLRRRNGSGNPPAKAAPPSNNNRFSQPVVQSFGGNQSASIKTAQPLRPASPSEFSAQPTDSTIRQTAIADNRVQPTNFSQPANNRPASTAKAVDLIKRYQVENAPDPLPGKPTRLLELLQQPIGSEARKTMVSQYWETWYDWSTLLSRAEYQNWLQSIPNPSSPAESALLNAARSAASDLVLASEIQLGKSQSRLNDFIPNSNGQLLPLPADQPLIQKYKTNYDLYQSYQMLPARFHGIDAMLPKTLELITKRANTVQLSKSAADQARQALSGRQTNVATVLEAARVWRSAEQDLISAVTRYNQAIADYSLTITNGSLPADRMVAMLIAPAKPNVRTQNGNNLRRGQVFNNSASSQINSSRQSPGMSAGQSFQSVQAPASRQNFAPPANQFGASGSASMGNGQFNSGNSFSSPVGPPPNQQPAARSANQSFGQFGNEFGR